MKFNTSFFTFLFLLFFLIIATDQSRAQPMQDCGITEFYQDFYDSFPEAKILDSLSQRHLEQLIQSAPPSQPESTSGFKYNIPMVFYFFHSTSYDPNAPSTLFDLNRVQDQIDLLNQYFNPYDINFCIATANIVNNIPEPFNITEANDMVGLPPGYNWNTPIQISPGIYTIEDIGTNSMHNIIIPTQYSVLNTVANNNNSNPPSGINSNTTSEKCIRVVICESGVNQNGSGIAGYANYPGTQTAGHPIFMDVNYFGGPTHCADCYSPANHPNPQSHYGKVLIHEIGHYLGLSHTFDGGGCDLTNDHVDDTPLQFSSLLNLANSGLGCDVNDPTLLNTLQSSSYSCDGGLTYPDPLNFMDYYSNDCKNLFTPGQIGRTKYFLDNYYNYLWSFQNLSSIQTSCNDLVYAGITGPTSVCINEGLTYEIQIPAALSVVNATWTFGDGTQLISSSASIQYAYSTIGDYEIKVEMTLSNNSTITTALGTVYVTSCDNQSLEESNWTFGNGSGLTFWDGVGQSFSPKLLESQIPTDFTCVSQSDDTGQLLFYSNGNNLWDSNGNLIPFGAFGTSLGNNPNQIKSTIIIPKPGSQTAYYLISIISGTADPLQFVEVQTSGGNITASNPFLFGSTANIKPSNFDFTSSMIEAIPDCNGDEYYLVLTAQGVTGTFIGKSIILVYQANANGINPINVFNFSATTPNPLVFLALSVSPNGQYLLTSRDDDIVSLFSFDNTNGDISFIQSLDFDFGVSYVTTLGNPFVFDQNSEYFYFQRLTGFNQEIVRYEIATGKFQVVKNLIRGGQFDLSGIDGLVGQLQLGPDKRIYGTHSNRADIMVINRPEDPISTGVDLFAFDISNTSNTNYAYLGLPNMIEAEPKPVSSPDDFGIVNLGCLEAGFNAVACKAPYTWTISDGTPAFNGPKYITHTFAQPGTYTVSCQFGNGNSISKIVTIGVSPVQSIGGPEIVCDSDQKFYSANIPEGYLANWTISNGIGTITNYIYDGTILVNWQSSGTLTLTLTSPNGCISTINKPVEMLNIDASFVLNPKSDICTSDPVLLINSTIKREGLSYSWDLSGSDAGTSNEYNPDLINYSTPGTFNIELSVSGSGCSDSEIKTIQVNEECCEHDYFADSDEFPNPVLGAINSSTTYSGGGTFNGSYLVEGTIILEDGIYEVLDGTFFYVEPNCMGCAGISNLATICEVFDEEKTQIILINAELRSGDAEFRSKCDEMWYGILAFDDSKIVINKSPGAEYGLIMDALCAITICDAAEHNDYGINKLSAINNIFGVYEVGNNEASINYYQVQNSRFDSKSSWMKEPYNGFNSFSSLVFSTQHHYQPYQYNEIRNTYFGFYHTSILNPDNSQILKHNTFKDFHVAAIATGGGINTLSTYNNNHFYFLSEPTGSSITPLPDFSTYTGLCSIYPASPIVLNNFDPNNSYGMMLSGEIEVKDNQFYGAGLIDDFDQKQTGVVSRIVFDHNGIISGDYFENNYLEKLNTAYRHNFADAYLSNPNTPVYYMGMNFNEFAANDLGIDIFEPSYGPLNLSQNIFTNNKNAIRINYMDNPMVISDNLFLDNDTAISVKHDNPNQDLNLNLGCNKFELSDLTATYDRYGLFIQDNADIGDVGGNGLSIDPAGNNWPIDSVATVNQMNNPSLPPYITSGDPLVVDVSLWLAPDDWYSIYDANANPTWTYWRWNNEFVGETDGAVNHIGLSVPAPPNPQGQATNAPHNGNGCISDLVIIFPQARKGQFVEKQESLLKVYPVPSANTVNIEHPLKKIKSIKVKTLNGTELPSNTIFIKNGMQIDLKIARQVCTY